MEAKELNSLIASIERLRWQIDTAFEDNGGELTDELQEQLDVHEELLALLQEDGIDALGRWLKGVQDRKAALKAEKDTINRHIEACSATEDYIRKQVRKALDLLGKDKVKGECYSFTSNDSRVVSADTEQVKALYYDKAVAAIREAGIPEYIGLSLRASSTAVPEGQELPDIFTVTVTPTTTFRKPKAAKEVAE